MAPLTIFGPDGQPITSFGQVAERIDMPVNNNFLVFAQRYTEGVRNPDIIDVDTYSRMRATDETVYSGLEFLTQAVLSRLGDYIHPNPAIQEFVRKQFQRMDGSFLRAVAQILKAVQFGFTVTEILWRQGKDGIELRGLQALHPRTITFDLHQDGPNKNKIRWIKQFWNRGYDQATIPLHKAIVYTHDEEFGNPYGCSRLKHAYKMWLIKDVLLKAWSITLERYGCPLAIATSTNITGKLNIDGVQMTHGEYLAKVLDSLSTAGSMVVPTGTTVEIKHYLPGAVGRDFDVAIHYCNRSIHQAIGLPSLIADTGDKASHALGGDHKDTFEETSVNSLLDDVTEVLLEQLVRPIIDYNFGPQEDYGLFMTETFDATLALTLAKICESLAKTGLVDMNNLTDVNHYRLQQNLPEWTEEDLRRAAQSSGVTDNDEFPGIEETPSGMSETEAPTGPDPDADAFSYAGKRRKMLRAQAELFRRICRKSSEDVAA